jgi:hypothetical protein
MVGAVLFNVYRNSEDELAASQILNILKGVSRQFEFG